jgi:hypothetical protein
VAPKTLAAEFCIILRLDQPLQLDHQFGAESEALGFFRTEAKVSKNISSMGRAPRVRGRLSGALTKENRSLRLLVSVRKNQCRT